MSSTAGARLRRAGRAVAGLSGRASSSVLSLSIAARPRLRVAGVGEVELAGASVAGVARECERGAVRRQQWSDLRAGGVDRGIQPHPGCPAVSAAFDPEQAVIGGDRKSVVSGKSVSVRVDLGGRRITK